MKYSDDSITGVYATVCDCYLNEMTVQLFKFVESGEESLTASAHQRAIHGQLACNFKLPV